MTIEEAKKLIKEEAYFIAYELNGSEVVDIEDSNKIINEIYDDFENRTCDNCKHFAKYLGKDYGDCYGKANAFSDIDVCHKDFGCNKWEAKNESKS